jgi:isopentenyl-diphosphate delta-isomerase
MHTQEASPIVSFEDEPLVLVDADDHVVGFRTKADCHAGAGLLHRAFSVFLFNERGEVLLQQRSANKRLWPLFWANSCCSHPRQGELMDAAAHRRTQEELQIETPLSMMYKFTYQASYGEEGSEHEMCSVYVGRVAEHVVVNANEVAAVRFVAPDKLDAELITHGSRYTPWLKLEWPRLRQQHWHQIEALLAAAKGQQAPPEAAHAAGSSA